MIHDLKECESVALGLPAVERAGLAERLIESLDSLDDTENERLWVQEAERRYQAHSQGKISARPAAEVIASMRARLR